MARSGYIYNVWTGSMLCGSFTVKREMLDAVATYERDHPCHTCHVTRVRDGGPLDRGAFLRVGIVRR